MAEKLTIPWWTIFTPVQRKEMKRIQRQIEADRAATIAWLKNPTGEPFGGDRGCRS